MPSAFSTNHLATETFKAAFCISVSLYKTNGIVAIVAIVGIFVTVGYAVIAKEGFTTTGTGIYAVPVGYGTAVGVGVGVGGVTVIVGVGTEQGYCCESKSHCQPETVHF